MPRLDNQAIEEDRDAVERHRTQFGDAAAEQLAAEIYKLRITPQPSSSAGFYGFPRFVIVLIALWVALLETAEKLPRLMLAYPGYEATLAELKAKMMQPDITAAQLERARNEAKASAYTPDTAAAQLGKAQADAKTAGFQPALSAAQAYAAERDAIAKGANYPDLGSVTRLEYMFDLIDPNHPSSVMLGVINPDMRPLFEQLYRNNQRALDHATKRLKEVNENKYGPNPDVDSTPDPVPTPKPTSTAQATAAPGPTFETPSIAMRARAAAEKAFAAGQYKEAYNFAKQQRELVEQMDTEDGKLPGDATAGVLISEAWYAIFGEDYERALAASERAAKIEPTKIEALIKKAHALMFLGREDEAKALYFSHRGERIDDKRTWNEAVLADMASLSDRAYFPIMADVTRDLASQNGKEKINTITNPAPGVPQPTPTDLRKPIALKCSDITIGSYYVICSSPQLMDAQARLEDAYYDASSTRGDVVEKEQLQWAKTFTLNCGLPLIGQPSPALIISATPCVRDALEARIRELRSHK